MASDVPQNERQMVPAGWRAKREAGVNPALYPQLSAGS